jgi:hypothetical protein
MTVHPVGRAVSVKCPTLMPSTAVNVRLGVAGCARPVALVAHSPPARQDKTTMRLRDAMRG